MGYPSTWARMEWPSLGLSRQSLPWRGKEEEEVDEEPGESEQSLQGESL